MHSQRTSSSKHDDDEPRIYDGADGKTVRFLGKDLYPKYPIADTQKRVSAISLEPGTLYIVASPLLGYGLAELEAKLPSDSVLFCWEANPTLSALCSNPLPDPHSERILFSAAPTCETAAAEALCLLNAKIRRVRSISLNAGRLLSHDEYRQLEQLMISEIQRFWRNRSTTLFMGPLWTRNILANIENFGQSISELPKRKHVVVCGAGPSLESGIGFIKKYRGHIAVLSVDTALPRLSAEGIQPDLIVALEAQLHNLQDFIGVDTSSSAIAIDLSATPHLMRTTPAKKHYYFVSEFAQTSLWDRMKRASIDYETIPALGSVGLCAIFLAQYFRPDTVYATGLDFAGLPGLTHAREAPAHRRALRTWSRLTANSMELYSLQENTIPVDDVSGKRMYTDKVLAQYHSDCAVLLSVLEKKGIRLFDLRDGGMPLPIPRFNGEKPEIFFWESEYPAELPKDAGQNAPSRSHAKTFFSELKRELETIAPQIRSFHQDGTQSDLGKKIIAGFQKIDFLFFDMPDSDWPALNTSALARALVRIEGMIAKLELLVGGFKN